MTAQLISHMIQRELRTLRRQLLAYENEADIWKTATGISNSAGNLALHLAGNLRHFIGHVIGGSDYQRDRDFEFNGRNIPRDELLEHIEAAVREVNSALAELPEAELDKSYPLPVAGHHPQIREYIIHLAVHLAYHLGQIDYHRRLITGSSETVGAISPREMKTATPED